MHIFTGVAPAIHNHTYLYCPQSIEYFLEWSLNPTNCAFEEIRRGLCGAPDLMVWFDMGLIWVTVVCMFLCLLINVECCTSL